MTKKKQKNKTILGFDEFEVLGNTFKIIETNDINTLLEGRDIPLGKCIPREHKVILDNTQAPQEVKQTFYHELLHLIDWLSHNENFTYDEETINVLARGLLTVKLG